MGNTSKVLEGESKHANFSEPLGDQTLHRGAGAEAANWVRAASARWEGIGNRKPLSFVLSRVGPVEFWDLVLPGTILFVHDEAWLPTFRRLVCFGLTILLG